MRNYILQTLRAAGRKPQKCERNVQGLLLCWYFTTSSLELKPNKITDDEIKYKSRIELRLTEPMLIVNKKDEDLFVSQDSSKPHVTRIPY